MHRQHVNVRKSHKAFNKRAERTEKRNLTRNMRGGIRL